MSVEPEHQSRFLTWLDAWTPRLLKLLGLTGFAMSLILAGVGQFNPALFGGSLMAASGGYVGDALHSLKAGRE
jgi:hypothetical protein